MSVTREAATRKLRALVATYLEGSADAARAVALLDVLDPRALSEQPLRIATVAQQDRQCTMFGCTDAAIDEALANKEPRDIAMYAMSTLSNAQELLWTVPARHANTIRQLMNIAKYAIDKAVHR